MSYLVVVSLKFQNLNINCFEQPRIFISTNPNSWYSKWYPARMRKKNAEFKNKDRENPRSKKNLKYTNKEYKRSRWRLIAPIPATLFPPSRIFFVILDYPYEKYPHFCVLHFFCLYLCRESFEILIFFFKQCQIVSTSSFS